MVNCKPAALGLLTILHIEQLNHIFLNIYLCAQLAGFHKASHIFVWLLQCSYSFDITDYVHTNLKATHTCEPWRVQYYVATSAKSKEDPRYKYYMYYHNYYHICFAITCMLGSITCDENFNLTSSINIHVMLFSVSTVTSLGVISLFNM